jgi:hypothetical protein
LEKVWVLVVAGLVPLLFILLPGVRRISVKGTSLEAAAPKEADWSVTYLGRGPRDE